MGVCVRKSCVGARVDTKRSREQLGEVGREKRECGGISFPLKS